MREKLFVQFLVFTIMLVLIFSLVFTTTSKAQGFKVLVLASKAKDHTKMIAAARPMLQRLAEENKFRIEITDDTSQVNDANLAQYDVFVQLHYAPFDMSNSQQESLQRFIEHGKGWVGIHAAGLTGKDFLLPGMKYWDWFQEYMGGVVYSPHPAFQKGTVIVEDRSHPVTKNLPPSFEISDEWYEFDKSPRPNVRVLARADESTYQQRKPMGDHPIIWINEKFDRMVYIGIGHDASLCTDKNFNILVRDAILWAASTVTK